MAVTRTALPAFQTPTFVHKLLIGARDAHRGTAPIHGTGSVVTLIIAGPAAIGRRSRLGAAHHRRFRRQAVAGIIDLRFAGLGEDIGGEIVRDVGRLDLLLRQCQRLPPPAVFTTTVRLPYFSARPAPVRQPPYARPSHRSGSAKTVPSCSI